MGLNFEPRTESEKARIKRSDEAARFTDDMIAQCKERNFTVKQFRQIADILEFASKILTEHVVATATMKGEEGLMQKDEAAEFAGDLIKQCQQQNYTLKQFYQVSNAFDFKCQLLESTAADTARMRD